MRPRERPLQSPKTPYVSRGFPDTARRVRLGLARAVARVRVQALAPPVRARLGARLLAPRVRRSLKLGVLAIITALVLRKMNDVVFRRRPWDSTEITLADDETRLWIFLPQSVLQSTEHRSLKLDGICLGLL